MPGLNTLLLGSMFLGSLSGPTPDLPAEWSNLPKLQYASQPRFTYRLSYFVIDEHRRGRCKVPRLANGWRYLEVDVAVLVDPGGKVLRAVPANVGCPTVESYSARTLEKLIKGKLIGPSGPDSAWYRTSMRYAWE